MFQARQLEGELEAKISTFAKLCNGYNSDYQGRGEAGLAADQVVLGVHANHAADATLLDPCWGRGGDTDSAMQRQLPQYDVDGCPSALHNM